MDFNDYQMQAMRTAGGGIDSRDAALNCAALGVAGESGEFADAIKKVIYHGHPIDRTALVKELGDVLWYIALAAHALNASLETVAMANLEKLRRRYPDGFSHERSMGRSDE